MAFSPPLILEADTEPCALIANPIWLPTRLLTKQVKVITPKAEVAVTTRLSEACALIATTAAAAATVSPPVTRNWFAPDGEADAVKV